MMGRGDRYNMGEPSATKRVKHEPMRKAHELAEEFGCTAQKLAKLVEHDPHAPRGVRLNKLQTMWYPLHSMRAWWRQRAK